MLDKNKNNKNKGQVLVLVALSMIVIIGFAALAIDVAYFYHTKHQLQGAADAAALAGAAGLDGTNSTTQTAARAAAVLYAFKNKAAGKLVELSSVEDGSENTLTANNDIVVGYWDGSDTVTPTGNQIANAVKVRARRTNEDSPLGISPGTAVTTFFGRIFGVSEVNISVTAIAERPPRPSTSLSVCIKSCPASGTFPPYTTLYFNEMGPNPPPPEQGVAWTEFSQSKSTNFGPNSQIAKYLRGEEIPPDVCCKEITTNNAAPGQIMSVLEEEFNKRAFLNSTTNRREWEVISPVFDNPTSSSGLPGCGPIPTSPGEPCPPGSQPDEPFPVARYAIMKITDVGGPPRPQIHINYIRCIPCPATELLGRRLRLVK